MPAAKPETLKKRHHMAFRVNDAMRDKMQSAAFAAQRSVSEEVEHRLQRYDDLDARVEMQAEVIQALLAALKAKDAERT